MMDKPDEDFLKGIIAIGKNAKGELIHDKIYFDKELNMYTTKKYFSEVSFTNELYITKIAITDNLYPKKFS